MIYSFGITQIIIIVIVAVIVLSLWYQIFSKAGYSGWLCLLLCVPLINFVTVIWFALSKWPVSREVERLRAAGARPMG